MLEKQKKNNLVTKPLRNTASSIKEEKERSGVLTCLLSCSNPVCPGVANRIIGHRGTVRYMTPVCHSVRAETQADIDLVSSPQKGRPIPSCPPAARRSGHGVAPGNKCQLGQTRVSAGGGKAEGGQQFKQHAERGRNYLASSNGGNGYKNHP